MWTLVASSIVLFVAMLTASFALPTHLDSAQNNREWAFFTRRNERRVNVNRAIEQGSLEMQPPEQADEADV